MVWVGERNRMMDGLMVGRTVGLYSMCHKYLILTSQKRFVGRWKDGANINICGLMLMVCACLW